MLPQPPRRLKIQTILSFLMDRPKSLFVGLIWGIFPIFMMIPMLAVFSIIEGENKVDYKKINQDGITTTAAISSIDTVYNTTINGRHPLSISYNFTLDNSIIDGQMQTMDYSKVKNYNVNDSIAIKHIGEKSIITNFEYFQFPWWIFQIIPFTFFMFGLPFLFYSFAGVLRKKKCYEYGDLKKAEIISMSPISIFFLPIFKNRFQVFYKFVNSQNEAIMDSSTIADPNFINEFKKGDSIDIFQFEKYSSVVDQIEIARNGWEL